MTEIKLCPVCWVKLGPMISRSTPRRAEPAFLSSIAHKLQECPCLSCRLGANVLRLEVVRMNLQRAWTQGP